VIFCDIIVLLQYQHNIQQTTKKSVKKAILLVFVLFAVINSMPFFTARGSSSGILHKTGPEKKKEKI